MTRNSLLSKNRNRVIIFDYIINNLQILMIHLGFVNFIVFVFLLLTGGAGLLMVVKDNPVHSVLSLIVAFCGGAVLLLINNAEFLAFIVLTVYVGAVMVLFLFVVMMIDVDKIKITKNSLLEKSIALIVGGVLCGFLIFAMRDDIKNKQSLIKEATLRSLSSIDSGVKEELQAKTFGMIIYSADYAILIIVASLILFVAIIGAITLTLREKTGLKKQNLFAQLLRSREDTLEVKKVAFRSGVDDE